MWITYNDGDAVPNKMKHKFPNNRGDLLNVDVPKILQGLNFKILADYGMNAANDLRSINVDYMRSLIFREPRKEEFLDFQHYVEKNFADKDYINMFRTYEFTVVPKNVIIIVCALQKFGKYDSYKLWHRRI